MKRILLMTLLITSLFGVPSLHAAHKKTPTIQELWNTSTVWIREYLVDVCAKVPNTAEAKKKLLAHQEQLGQAFRPYYNEKITQEFIALLKQQGQLTIDLVHAIATHNKETQAQLERSWKQNANSLSCFLSKNNPYMDFRTIRDMLYDYLGLLTLMITYRATQKWEDDMNAYDNVRALNEQLAQIIGQGIKNAFPLEKPKAQESKPPLLLGTQPDKALLRTLA